MTQSSRPSSPPVAEQRPHNFTRHGVTISDPWAWLKDPAYPEVKDKDVLAYLEAENAWFEAEMQDQKPLIETLFNEMRARIKEDDSSVPFRDGDWYYWVEFEKGAQYKKWYRSPTLPDGSKGDARILLLDEPALANGLDYFKLGGFSISNNGKLLAFATDTNGGERYDVRIKNLETGEILPDTIAGILSAMVWVENDTGLVYGLANKNWRTDNARLHRLGTSSDDDIELYREDDEGFGVGVGLTSNEKWLVIATGDNETSEVRMVSIDDVTAEPILVSPRQKGREYDVDERDGLLYIHTNDTHVNFRLATAPLEHPGDWTTLIAGSDDFYMTGVSLFRDFYVIEGRRDGLDQIELRYYDEPGRVEPIVFPEASYTVGLTDNAEWHTDTLRLGYESMVTPDTVYDYDIASHELTVLKVQEIPSGYEQEKYATERVMVEARDGVLVPVSLVFRSDTPLDGTAPLHLYAYGAYGYAVPPSFSTTRLSLIDRGFIYAIAHIRGGDDLGRNWYLQGKREQRTNTFNDFVDVARGLIAKGYSRSGKISASGGSAGGKLMGAIVNQAPEIWGAIAAHVPFVDVLNTMLDETLPLTPGEWPEWGNPMTDRAAFDLIRSYSPYDNVRAQDYPPMLVTAGLNDPRVTYWEPAKWVARLRATKTDGNTLLLKTNMGAGHAGKSGRFESLRETAEEFAFLLKHLSP